MLLLLLQFVVAFVFAGDGLQLARLFGWFQVAFLQLFKGEIKASTEKPSCANLSHSLAILRTRPTIRLTIVAEMINSVTAIASPM